MTTFDHRHRGTSEADWVRRGLDDLAVVAVPGEDARVLVVAAHPDDETLGAGALIAEAARRGADVRVVIATNGEASHPGSTTHSPERLAQIRRAEVVAALRGLAPSVEPVFLDLPDGRLDADAVAAALAEHVHDRTHLVTPWAGDRHPDHAACAEAVARLRPDGVRHWQYPIWAWHWDDPRDPVLPWAALRRTEPDAVALRAKQRALAEHRSQHAELSVAPGDEAILPPDVVAHFRRDAEYFVVDAPTADPTFFEHVYATDEDPWGLAHRFYERRKRALLLAALPREHFRRAFEPGCATGLLTAELARRCDRTVAWDGAAAAVARARDRLADVPSVELAVSAIPGEWPDGEFDLVVLSEVGYYCQDLDALARRVTGCLSTDGVVAAVHWRHDAPDHPHTATAVHDALGRRLLGVVQHVEDDFLLDVWTRDGTSVAAAEGLTG